MVVPNIMAYATHSAVGIYDPGRHFTDLDEMTPALVGDALTAMVRHAQAVRRLDPTAQWSSINANYLPPAGSSLVHPHLQSAHDAHGLTGQRLLVEHARAWQDRHGSYWAALVEQEAGGPRWVGCTGPGGLADALRADRIRRGVGRGRRRGRRDRADRGGLRGPGAGAFPGPGGLPGLEPGLVQLRPDRRRADAREDGHHVVLKVLSRSNPEPVYRSDATYFERIWGEALIDLSPEEVADSVRTRF